GEAASVTEFRDCIPRGRVSNLAVGSGIGARCTSVGNSFVNDILMPPIGLLTGGIDFSDLYINLSGEEYPSLAAAKEAGAATINYGVFLNAVRSEERRVGKECRCRWAAQRYKQRNSVEGDTVSDEETRGDEKAGAAQRV